MKWLGLPGQLEAGRLYRRALCACARPAAASIDWERAIAPKCNQLARAALVCAAPASGSRLTGAMAPAESSSWAELCVRAKHNSAPGEAAAPRAARGASSPARGRARSGAELARRKRATYRLGPRACPQHRAPSGRRGSRERRASRVELRRVEASRAEPSRAGRPQIPLRPLRLICARPIGRLAHGAGRVLSFVSPI